MIVIVSASILFIMKSILKTLKKRWAEYIMEIIVIIIGIIGAFMLNSWHEDRKEKEFERKVLIELQASIEDNIGYLDSAIYRSEEARKSGRLILDYFDSDLEYNDSLDRHFSTALFWFHPSLNNRAYEGLKSYGLHLISNDSIRDKLGEIYEWSFINRLSLRQEEYFYSSVSPHLGDWFDTYQFIGEMKPLNFEELKTSTKYRHIINTMIYNRTMQMNYFEDIRQARIDLVEMIKIELQ